MEKISDEVLLKITNFLSGKDLLSCSSVSKKWREKFNNDKVWENKLMFSDKYYCIQKKYQGMICCTPYFSTLQPLCAARKNYIRDQCLKFNWRAGLFTIESFPTDSGKIFDTVHSLDEKGNYWLLLNSDISIEIWNITNKPRFQSKICKKMPATQGKLFMLDTKVVSIFGNFVEIFLFEHPKYELSSKCCFFICKESVLDEHDCGPLNPTLCWVNFEHIICGNILIGYSSPIPKSQAQEARMHIWNLETLVKLGSVSMIPNGVTVHRHNKDDGGLVSESMVNFCLYQGDIMKVINVIKKGNTSVISIFDLQRLEFLEFAKQDKKTSFLEFKIIDDLLLMVGFTLVIDEAVVFASVIDLSGNECAKKNLTHKYGADCNSTIVPSNLNNSDIFIKTREKFISIELKDSKLTSSSIPLTISDLIQETCAVTGHFMFSFKNEQPAHMWDLNCRHVIRDMQEWKGDIDHSLFRCLKDVHFPPKLAFTNINRNKVTVLSFW